MTSKEFITRQFGNADGKTKSLSSIYKDQNGNIYSYGHHYPLMFEVDGVTFVNALGYSNTTAKHINWAMAASDYTAIKVWLSGCNLYTWRNPENVNRVPAILNDMAWYGDNDASNYKATDRLKRAILKDLRAEISDINTRMAAKARKNTALYAGLESELADATRRLESVKAAWSVK